MTKRIVMTVCAVMISGCVKEISSDERLERETARSDALRSATAGELSKLKCDEFKDDILKARDDAQSEESRLTIYTRVFEQLKVRTAKFDEAISRNPDLAYQEGSQEIVAGREGCIQQSADVKNDFETLVREIMLMPTVDEIKGGSTVKVARLNFDVLRAAIEKLESDDRDSMLTKVNNAEKQVEAKGGAPKKK